MGEKCCPAQEYAYPEPDMHDMDISNACQANASFATNFSIGRISGVLLLIRGSTAAVEPLTPSGWSPIWKVGQNPTSTIF